LIGGIELKKKRQGWKDAATQEWLRTCTIITSDPYDQVALKVPVKLADFSLHQRRAHLLQRRRFGLR
jgi:hypothetical protein